MENSYESSHTSRLDDYLTEAKESGDKQVKKGDNQSYDAKQAIKDASSGLGSMVEQSKNEIRQQSEESNKN